MLAAVVVGSCPYEALDMLAWLLAMHQLHGKVYQAPGGELFTDTVTAGC